MTTTVEVELLGRKLPVRADDPARVEEAARIVAQHIDALRAGGGAIATDRLLLLVALNLAGELLDARAEAAGEIEGLLDRLDALVSQAEGLANAPLR